MNSFNSRVYVKILDFVKKNPSCSFNQVFEIGKSDISENAINLLDSAFADFSAVIFDYDWKCKSDILKAYWESELNWTAESFEQFGSTCVVNSPIALKCNNAVTVMTTECECIGRGIIDINKADKISSDLALSSIANESILDTIIIFTSHVTDELADKFVDLVDSRVAPNHTMVVSITPSVSENGLWLGLFEIDTTLAINRITSAFKRKGLHCAKLEGSCTTGTHETCGFALTYAEDRPV